VDKTRAAFAAVGRVYGTDAQNRLAQAHVCIAGIGGVGSWVVEALARSGIGELTIIDHDDVSETNINRQIHADYSTIDRSKVVLMQERIEQINPECQCTVIDDMLVSNNMEKYIDTRFDYVVDAIDLVRFKAELLFHCRRNRIPVLSVGGAGGRTDPTQVQIADLSKTWNDSLAANVRHRLRSHHGYSHSKKFRIECVFSTEQARFPTPTGSTTFQKPGVAGASLDCDTGYGSLVTVTATFGMIAAARVMNKLVAA